VHEQKDPIRDLANHHILLVKNNKMNQIITTAMLAETEVKITLAENGQEALEKLHSNIDLVLMDIQMPVMDGIEATRHIQKLRPELAVIALTANVSSDDIALYNTSGFIDVIAKPVDKAQMLSIIYKHI
jgi:CheY-like chemotaxis protein